MYYRKGKIWIPACWSYSKYGKDETGYYEGADEEVP